VHVKDHGMLKHQVWSIALIGTLSQTALAADVKKECVDASTEGQTSRDAGELLSARDKFVVCSRDACPAVVRSSCANWLSEIDQQVPSIVIRAADASNADITDGNATVDGVQYPLNGKAIPLDPGKHVVVLDTEQGVHLEKTVLLAAGEKSRLIELRVPAPAGTDGANKSDATSPPKAKPSSGGVPTGAWVLGGLGVVALGSFGFFAVSAKSELTKLEDSCSPGCTDSQTKTGRNNALIADVSLGIGVAALAGAVTWTLLSGSSEEEPKSAAQLTLAPTPNGAYAGVSGRF
jgi:hypothetical protein